MASAEEASRHGGTDLRKFLVVDDNAEVRRAVAEMLCLAFAGCDVRTFSSGEDAVAMMKSGAASAVIMDINLPGISGIEATRRIRATSGDVPIVMLSMHEEDEYVRAALNAGASAYVLKREIGGQLVKALLAAQEKRSRTVTE